MSTTIWKLINYHRLVLDIKSVIETQRYYKYRHFFLHVYWLQVVFSWNKVSYVHRYKSTSYLLSQNCDCADFSSRPNRFEFLVSLSCSLSKQSYKKRGNSTTWTCCKNVKDVIGHQDRLSNLWRLFSSYISNYKSKWFLRNLQIKLLVAGI